MTWWGYALAAVISAAAVLGSQWLSSRREDRRAAAERESKRLDRLYSDRLRAAGQVLNDLRALSIVVHSKADDILEMAAQMELAATSTQVLDALDRFSLLCDDATNARAKSIGQTVGDVITALNYRAAALADPSRRTDLAQLDAAFRARLNDLRTQRSVFHRVAREAIGAEPIPERAKALPELPDAD